MLLLWQQHGLRRKASVISHSRLLSGLIARRPIAEIQRQKAEKIKKIAEKQANNQVSTVATKAARVSKNTEELPQYVEQTPYGEKKSGHPRQCQLFVHC